MAMHSVNSLPLDLFHLLTEQLSDSGDFPTLYSCVVSSKQIANAGAISALYRISHDCPIKSGGSETLPLAEQELNVQKWSILWRTIIMSALGKTLYPYCRHLRMLDLRDLGYLLEDDKFRGKISKQFFADDLAQFHFLMNTPLRLGGKRFERLDRNKIISAVGNKITQQAPLLEGISEPVMLDVLTNNLPIWGPRLGHLRRLELFDGKAFADETVRNLLHAHCPNLEIVGVYLSSHPESDQAMAAFISGMPKDKLVEFENMGDCGIGAETCLALNHHGNSLRQLKLSLDEQGVLSLGLLQSCTSLHTLAIGTEKPSVDLKATQNDVYLEIVEWLKKCKELKDLSFHNIASAPDLITPVLQNKSVLLEELEVNATKDDSHYVVKDHHNFHNALSQQPTLRRLHLRADPDPITRDDIDTLMNALCSLSGLLELKLVRISDYFSDEHITLLGNYLPELETLTIGGYGISGNVFPGISKLKKLKAVSFTGITTFTSDGIMDYIDQLDRTGNFGLNFSVENADPDSAMSQEEQDLLSELIQTKVDGRFEYQLLRDPNVPEFEGDDSD